MTTEKNVVLTLKRLAPSGNGDRHISSSQDQSVRAMRLKAGQLTTAGQGGGIVPLLLPKDDKQARRLAKDKTLYEPVEVTPRDGEGRDQPQFAASRAPFERDDVRQYLYKQFISTLSPNSSLRQRSVTAQCRWLQAELKLRNGDIYKYLSRHAADFLELDGQRSLRWLRDRLSRKGKRQS